MFDRFHYGVCYYPEHWAADMHDADFRRMKETGFDVVRMGEGAWGYWEPTEGKFQFDLFDRALELCRKYDLKVVLGTPTYCAPAWLSSKYPEVLRWDYQRRPMAHGSRRNLNYTSPRFLDLSDKLCTALAQHYQDHPQIIGWQLDNELNCHMDVSYAPSDTAAFRVWLKKKYETLERLNRAWGTDFWSQHYTAWDQIDLPAPTPTVQNPTQLLDEVRFISDTVVAFAKRQADILRRACARWQITTNGLFGNINGPDLAAQLDFFGHDQYPLFSSSWAQAALPLAQTRSLSFPYAILEQQSGPGGQLTYFHRTARPGEMRLWAWQSIAHGAKFLSYFRWRTCPYGAEQHWHGLLDADNRDTRRLAEAKAIGEEIRALPADFYDAPPIRNVAIFREFDNETNERRINTYAQDGNGEAQRWMMEMSRRHISADFVWPGSDLSGYRVIIAPHLRILTPMLSARLHEAVKAGAHLIIGAQSGTKDINCHMTSTVAPGLLAKLAGVEVVDWSTLEPDQSREARTLDGQSIALSSFIERLQLQGARPLAYWKGDDALLGDAPAITWHDHAGSAVIYIGGYCVAAAIPAIVDLIASQTALTPIAGATSDVELIERRGKAARYVVAMNHTSAAQRVSVVSGAADLLNGGKAVDGDLKLPGYGVAVLRMPAK